ncbi:ribosomal maturation YjgA family protein [Calothrix sp. 336/3]|uniref:ribosomal maturation YjgA family protein n=1 Tax=Calothrix sp. 336/3 TaxID=1337936 RepID=UPI0004E391A4|nr:DUF2809 domain-containing protein [Calothrix sp. 336/3]AKG20398.1 hypothetical protein IJ00_02840 [Calothrix sp. 336/3]
MSAKSRQNIYIAISLLFVTILGFALKYYNGFAQEWFNNSGAAIFYEIFWCLFAFCFFRSQRAIITIPIWVFIATALIEFLQLWHLPLLQQFRATFIGKTLLGTTFTWWDFPHYLIGCILGWLWLRMLSPQANAKTSKS